MDIIYLSLNTRIMFLLDSLFSRLTGLFLFFLEFGIIICLCLSLCIFLFFGKLLLAGLQGGHMTLYLFLVSHGLLILLHVVVSSLFKSITCLLQCILLLLDISWTVAFLHSEILDQGVDLIFAKARIFALISLTHEKGTRSFREVQICWIVVAFLQIDCTSGMESDSCH